MADTKRYPIDKLASALKSARRPGMPLSVPVFREAIGAYEDRPCYLCGEPMTEETASLDHVVPAARGGTTTPDNVKWAHGVCNRVKSDLTVAELVALARKIVAWQSKVVPT